MQLIDWCLNIFWTKNKTQWQKTLLYRLSMCTLDTFNENDFYTCIYTAINSTQNRHLVNVNVNVFLGHGNPRRGITFKDYCAQALSHKWSSHREFPSIRVLCRDALWRSFPDASRVQLARREIQSSGYAAANANPPWPQWSPLQHISDTIHASRTNHRAGHDSVASLTFC